MTTPHTEKCHHNVVAKHCFRCKRPDLAGLVPNTTKEDVPKGIEGIIQEYTEMIEGTAHKPLSDWLRTKLTTLQAELMKEVGADYNHHICRFNDYPQKCECYNKALDDTKAIITSVFEA